MGKVFLLKATWQPVKALLSLAFPSPPHLLPHPTPSSLTLFLAFNPHPSSVPPFSFNGTRNEWRKERVEICFQTNLDGGKHFCQRGFALSRGLTNFRHRDKGVNGLINPIWIQCPYLNINKQIQISCKCSLHSKHVGSNLTILAFFLFIVPPAIIFLF